ncbi:MAG: hypothetical protein AAF723_04995, partial [Pseudomonadota bacterium]
MRVLLVSMNASYRMGGEAVLPLHWLRELRAAGVEADLLTHQRGETEHQTLGLDPSHFHYIDNTLAERKISRAVRNFPKALKDLILLPLELVTYWRLAKRTKKLVQEKKVDLVHQVIPVSPRSLSFLGDVGALVVIGP